MHDRNMTFSKNHRFPQTMKNVAAGTYKNNKVFIRTSINGDPSKPKLVMLPGYKQSSSLFFNLTKALTKHFQVIYTDLVGMGGSSRPGDFDTKFTVEESIDYFVEYLERWRKEMGDLDDFYLAGHSYGGYLVGNYASKYPERIKKLLLLSPLGVNSKIDPKDVGFKKMTKSKEERKLELEPKAEKMIMKLMDKIQELFKKQFEKGESPFV